MADTAKALRLDAALVARGLVGTRARARDLVLRGLVTVDGVVHTKPALAVGAACGIAVSGEAARRVSRGAEKLVAGLAEFGFSPMARVCLDVGASSGGFTEVLLERGARHVFAVDVGRGQLHARLASDPRVTSLEGCDARSLSRAEIRPPIEAMTADVSFISLVKALPAALALAAPGCWLVALVKPQFEVGRASVGKGGIVRDAAARARAVEQVAVWLEACGWNLRAAVASPITGGDGNQEFLLGAVRS